MADTLPSPLLCPPLTILCPLTLFCTCSLTLSRTVSFPVIVPPFHPSLVLVFVLRPRIVTRQLRRTLFPNCCSFIPSPSSCLLFLHFFLVFFVFFFFFFSSYNLLPFLFYTNKYLKICMNSWQGPIMVTFLQAP